MGGGFYNTSSSPRLYNCLITNNSANRDGGGIFNSLSSSPSLINCLIAGNSATTNGGGILNYQSSPRLINCTLADNQAGGQGLALSNLGESQPGLTNTILVNRLPVASNNLIYNEAGTGVTARYCLIGQGESDFTGSNNLTATSWPFVSDANYQLKAGSQAVNTGNIASYSAVNGLPQDLAGQERLQGGQIDLGPFELAPNLTPQLYARPSPTHGNTPFTVVVEVSELNAVSADGTTTLRINKDARLTLQLNPSLSSVEGRPVQNSQWRLDSGNEAYYILTTSQSIPAGASLSVGLSGALQPGSTSGVLTVSGLVVTSKGESSLNNNTDSDKIDYFQ